MSSLVASLTASGRSLVDDRPEHLLVDVQLQLGRAGIFSRVGLDAGGSPCRRPGRARGVVTAMTATAAASERKDNRRRVTGGSEGRAGGVVGDTRIRPPGGPVRTWVGVVDLVE